MVRFDFSKAHVIYGFSYCLLVIVSAALQDMYFWIVEQVLIFLMLVGYFRPLQKIPLVRSIDDNAARMRKFYRDNPRYLSTGMILMRFVPFVYYFVFWHEIKLVLLIFILSLPIDMVLELAWAFAVNFPSTGFIERPAIWLSILKDTYYTAFSVPFLVMLAVGTGNKTGQDHSPVPGGTGDAPPRG